MTLKDCPFARDDFPESGSGDAENAARSVGNILTFELPTRGQSSIWLRVQLRDREISGGPCHLCRPSDTNMERDRTRVRVSRSQ